MITVVVALVPCIFMALWNTGYQANLAMQEMGLSTAGGWRGVVMDIVGLGYSPSNFIVNILHGALYFFPVFIVCNVVGGLWEGLFATLRGHEINEGFLVTGMLFPLTSATDHPTMAGCSGHQLRRRCGQRGFRRHG